jgi:DNA-binding GntR family transcriptional regulator
VGTQVVHAQVRRPVELTSLFDDLSRANHHPTTTVLVLDRRPAEGAAASALGLSDGADVIFLERLRFDGNRPLALMRNWLPAGLIDLGAEALEGTGLYDLLRRAGVHIKVANQRIGARNASAADARRLEIKTGAALVTMERTAFDDTGRAVEYATHSYRADLYSFETTVVGR